MRESEVRVSGMTDKVLWRTGNKIGMGKEFFKGIGEDPLQGRRERKTLDYPGPAAVG